MYSLLCFSTTGITLLCLIYLHFILLNLTALHRRVGTHLQPHICIYNHLDSIYLSSVPDISLVHLGGSPLFLPVDPTKKTSLFAYMSPVVCETLCHFRACIKSSEEMFYLKVFLKFQAKWLVLIFLLGNVSKICTANGLTPIRVDYVRECGYNPNNTVEENSVSMTLICRCGFNMLSFIICNKTCCSRGNSTVPLKWDTLLVTACHSFLWWSPSLYCVFSGKRTLNN